MRIAKIFSLSLSLMLLATGCKKPEQGSAAPAGTAKRMYVETSDGLRMRSAPNTQASTVLTIPHGEEVAVVEESGESLTVSGRTGKWTKVTYDSSTGWVFGGFLSASAPCITAKKAKSLTCNASIGDRYTIYDDMITFPMSEVNHNILSTKVNGCVIDYVVKWSGGSPEHVYVFKSGENYYLSNSSPTDLSLKCEE